MIGMFALPFGPMRKTAIIAAPNLDAARKVHPEARPLTVRELCAAFTSQVPIAKFDVDGVRQGNAQPKDFAPEFAATDGITI